MLNGWLYDKQMYPAESQRWKISTPNPMTGHHQSKLPPATNELFQCESISSLGRPRFHRPGAARRLCLGQQGQSLVEVAIMIPIFTVLVCYAVDFGFFFLVATSSTLPPATPSSIPSRAPPRLPRLPSPPPQ